MTGLDHSAETRAPTSEGVEAVGTAADGHRERSRSHSPFVGRHLEIGLLKSRLAKVADGGAGSLFLLAGEPGVGKTRLARELAEHATSAGFAVLWGAAFEGEWQPAYSPWVEALGASVRRGDVERLRRVLGQAVLPLASLIPELGSASAQETSAALGAREERFRLYDAVRRLLEAIASEQPLLLVLDDLHWADHESLYLLRYLARFVERMPVLVVVAYRHLEPEWKPRDAMADLLAELCREPDCEQLQLRGLPYSEVIEYLDQAAGQSLPKALARAVYSETGGNPFYLQSVFQHLVEEGKIQRQAGRWFTDLAIGELGIPDGVRQVVSRRVSRLSEATASLLRSVSGFTGGFTLPEVQALSGLAEDPLLDCLDESIAAGLLRVVGTSPPNYDFFHAIVRHTLYDSLNPDRRARLSRRIALALESVYAGREEEHAAELASQYHASASLPGAERGVPYALAAAEQARSAFAFEREVSFLRIGRDLSDTSDLPVRARILRRLALAEGDALLLDDAARSLEDALVALQATGAPPLEQVELVTEMARSLKEGGAPPGIWEPLIERGLALAGPERNLVWARLALLRNRFETISTGLVNAGRWLGLDPDAVAVARALGDEDDYARTLDRFGWRRPAETEEVIERARVGKRPAAILQGLDVAAHDLLYCHGDFERATELYKEMLRVAEHCGSIFGEATALTQLAFAKAVLGHLEDARVSMDRSLDEVGRLGSASYARFVMVGGRSYIGYYLDVDYLALAEAAAGYASRPSTARMPHGLTAAAYAALNYARAGREGEARRFLDALTPVVGRMEPTMYLHAGVVAFGAAVSWELGAVEYAQIYRRLARRLMSAGIGHFPLGPHELTIGRMSALLGEVDEALDAFERARDRVKSAPHRPLQAIIAYDEALARFRLGADDPCRIRSLLDEALAAFDSLGMAGWSRRTLDLRSRLDVSVSALEARKSADRSESVQGRLLPRDGQAHPGGLTPRELEVLRLLALGRTGREIADELVLSVSTVERHTANIYVKLGVHGRVEAAAFAIHHGVVLGIS